MSNMRFPTGWGFIVAVVLVFPNFPPDAFAAECEKPVAVAVSVQGVVNARKGGAAYWEPVRRKDTFCPGDAVRVMEQSRADLLLINETTLRLDQNTEIVFTAPEREKQFFLDVLFGATYFMSRTPRTFKIHTPFVNAGVEGTEFFIGVEKDRVLLTVFEGRIAAANDRGEAVVTGGQSVVAEAGRAPVLGIEARPRDAVRWTLFFPSIVAPRPGAPQSWQDRAANLLAVGRVEEARMEIDEALKTAPGNADALSLLAVIAVAQNEKEKALDLAKKAVAAAPDSATARVALSYAQQAEFALEGALASLREAVKIEHGNALARARLSELLLSFGRLDEALGEARKAAGQNPDIARTQSVLGFAYLAQIKTKESRDAFERAIVLDQADPLPRLGLGLATIRDGDVEAGRKEIEIAASLDPNNSLIRSYLGKAYYEEKRGKTASKQFSMAKELDPNDPTPYLYDAILKQSVNRPVEALHDLRKSISLNDNRAVYRSRLLLDEDLAIRSASLGRIYDDLGFQQLALVEGWKSVNTDPANYSAHQLLADSYAVLPRHEIATVSELLQSQLLQPLSINPVQPLFAQSKRLLLSGTGPSSVAFNEYSPMFERNRVALQGSGVFGNEDTAGDEVVLSGLRNRFSGNVGQYHYETNGFRANDDLTDNIYDVFLQASVTAKTSLQAEYRYRDTDEGDRTLRFDPNYYSQALRQTNRSNTARFGLRQAFSPGSDLIGSFIYRDTDDSLKDSLPGAFSIDWDTDEDGFLAELEYLYRAERLNVNVGAGRAETHTTIHQDFLFIVPFPPFQLSDSDVVDEHPRQTNAYLYSRFEIPGNVHLTLGASGDFYEDVDVKKNQFNPKLGISWDPLPGTTIRAAAFRVLSRTLTTDQTIEPTQVAGFNQFFDDYSGTTYWRYGGAVDQVFSPDVSGGAEYAWRDLKFPNVLTDPTGTSVRQIEWKERTGRAYLYWTPHPWFGLSAEYFYEWLDRGPDAALDGLDKVTTNRFPLGVTFFHPCGASAGVKATYIDQDGKFIPQGSPDGTPGEYGSDQFWVVDAAIGYRLPKRHGILTLEGKNLFNKSFRYQDTDHDNPSIQPERTVVFRFTLSI
jgi:tetratricopeptide (TPR) repeat protein